MSPTHAPVPSADRPPALVRLERLAELVLLANAPSGGKAEPSHLLYVEEHSQPQGEPELGLGFLALEQCGAQHPAEALIGFVAPDRWWAVGILGTGRAHRIEPDQATAMGFDHTPPADAPDVPVGRVRLAHLASRSGHSVLALQPGWTDEVRIVSSSRPEPGLVTDACRRVLGLPAAPPTLTPASYWADVWLDELMTMAMCEPHLLHWPEIVDAHPLREQLTPDATPEQIHQAVQERSAAGWEPLLAHARQRGAVLADGSCCPAELAAWFDEGSFSRAVAGVLPRRTTLLANLAGLVPRALFERVLRSLDAPAPS